MARSMTIPARRRRLPSAGGEFVMCRLGRNPVISDCPAPPARTGPPLSGTPAGVASWALPAAG